MTADGAWHPHPAPRPATGTETPKNRPADPHIYTKSVLRRIVRHNQVKMWDFKGRGSPPRQKHAPCHTYLRRKRGPILRRREQTSLQHPSTRGKGGGTIAGTETTSGKASTEKDAMFIPTWQPGLSLFTSFFYPQGLKEFREWMLNFHTVWSKYYI